MLKGLSSYRKRRNFKITKEPKGSIKKSLEKKSIFVIQKHAASHLHYDLRLEMQGVLKSWAIPKEPSKTEKRLAILTEDHPMDYADFEGTIPQGEYGAGEVKVWDKGSFDNLKIDKKGKSIPIETCFKKGIIEVFLEGKKLRGLFALVHFKDKNWLFFKMKKKGS